MSDVGVIDPEKLLVKTGFITANGNSSAKSGFLNISSFDVAVAVTAIDGTSVAFLVQESTTGSGSWTTVSGGGSHTITGTGTYEYSALVPTKDYVRITWTLVGTKARIFVSLAASIRAGMAQAAHVAALTDNSGGAAADGTIAVLTGVDGTASNAAPLVATKDAIKELSTKLNALIAALEAAGVTAAS